LFRKSFYIYFSLEKLVNKNIFQLNKKLTYFLEKKNIFLLFWMEYTFKKLQKNKKKFFLFVDYIKYGSQFFDCYIFCFEIFFYLFFFSISFLRIDLIIFISTRVLILLIVICFSLILFLIDFFLFIKFGLYFFVCYLFYLK